MLILPTPGYAFDLIVDLAIALGIFRTLVVGINVLLSLLLARLAVVNVHMGVVGMSTPLALKTSPLLSASCVR